MSENVDSSPSNSSHAADCNGSLLSSNGVSKEINLEFTQTLMNIKALNGQTNCLGEDKTMTSEDAIVILDDPPADASPNVPVPAVSSATGAPSSLFSVSLLPPKPMLPMVESTKTSIFELPKTSKFEINDRVRSSFKDIMSKIQENTPSLQNLLAKTKDLDTRERKEERERLEREQQAAKASAASSIGKGSGDNVFENLKGLNCDRDLVEKPVPKNGKCQWLSSVFQ